MLLPFSGLFRIDAAAGRFFVGGWQIWWDDFFIVFPFWAMVFFSMTAFYSNFGMIFCGWMCPQHTLSEWLNGLIRRLLGRRVLAGISPERVPGRSKRKRGVLVLAWAGFVAVVLLVSAVLTLTVLHYFFPFEALWGHFVEGRFNLYIAVFAILLGTFVVVDLGLLRHFWCKYMCPYGLWQYMFRNRDTLQIRFDATRQDDCRRCTLCKDVCPMDLDPRQPEVYTRCINCAICIDACEGYMGRFDKGPILSFGFGTAREALIRIETGRSRILAPGVLWPLAGVLISVLLFGYGLATFEPVKLVVHQEAGYAPAPGRPGLAYRAVILNKDAHPHTFVIKVAGPSGGVLDLPVHTVSLEAGERADLRFAILNQGLETDRPYPFTVTAVRDGSGRSTQTEAVYYLPAVFGGPDGGAG